MNNDSPFANRDVPIIGQPKILNIVAVGLIQCNCEGGPLMMGPIGGAPMTCHACKKTWLVEAAVQVTVSQVVNPVDSTSTIIQ